VISSVGGRPANDTIVVRLTRRRKRISLAKRRDSGARNRPARVGLVAGILGLAGVLAFFLSAPIIFGGLAVTLGLEGRRRATTEGRASEAIAAIAVGAVAFLVGAGIWVFA
jgi:hypothetical protein